MRCPICEKTFSDEKLKPFCSERCRLIDLGNWLGGGYRVPAEPDRDDDPSAD